MIKTHELSARAACRNLNLSRSVFCYQAKPNKDDEVVEALQGLAEHRPAYGSGLMFATLRREGKGWNHKRVYRVYKALNLHRRRKGKKRLPSRSPTPLVWPQISNHCWSIDFMSDSLYPGRWFRTFNVVDDHNRELWRLRLI
jgi:putative transposase